MLTVLRFVHPLSPPDGVRATASKALDMQRLVLRWALWGCLFVLGTLMAVGLDRFFVPPHESIPLVTVARRPPAIE